MRAGGLQFVIDRPAMLGLANVGLPAIDRCDHRTARRAWLPLPATRNPRRGWPIPGSRHARRDSAFHRDPSGVEITSMGAWPGIFAIDFANDLLDFVMRVRKRFYDQANIFPALEFLAKSAHQNVGRLARKTGRDVQEVKRISTGPVDRFRRLAKECDRPRCRQLRWGPSRRSAPERHGHTRTSPSPGPARG